MDEWTAFIECPNCGRDVAVFQGAEAHCSCGGAWKVETTVKLTPLARPTQPDEEGGRDG